MVSPFTNGIAADRITPQDAEQNFADLHPPLDPHEALVAADRCYFCHDAPCTIACPTDIDVPLFIRQIATGTPEAAARTIFDQNILGGMCARVCPTETLCEEACVRELAEGKPVEIGRLQRFATDTVMAKKDHPYTRAKETGKSVAIVGAGPAGLAAAHRLAMLGHSVVIYDARPKGGGLNEYGIAAYKTVDGFAQAELDWLMGIGGITLKTGAALGGDLTLDGLSQSHDAVFLGIGLGGVNALTIEGAATGTDAVAFIADLRQATDKSKIAVGRRVVVIGGGMTAVDAAVQAKFLGAEDVAIAYRKDQDAMSASTYEQELAQANGVRIVTNANPKSLSDDGATFTNAQSGEDFTLAADQILVAIGQRLEAAPDLALERGKILVSGPGRTSQAGVWAGGDCALGGDDLTVTAVAEGRDAAMDIHTYLLGAN